MQKQSKEVGNESSDRKQLTSRQDDQWLAHVQLRDSQVQRKPKSFANKRASDKGFLKITREADFQLVDWTGRRIVMGKKGSTPKSCRPISERLGFEENSWLDVEKNFGRLFKRVAGTNHSFQAASQKKKQSRYRSSGGPALIG